MGEVILSCWSSLYTELNHNPIKWCWEEQSSYSLGFTSQSLHPNPEEMGKLSFQLILMASPGPLGLRGPQSSDILELILFSQFKIPWAWLDHSETACFISITTLSIHSHFLQQQLSNQRWKASTKFYEQQHRLNKVLFTTRIVSDNIMLDKSSTYWKNIRSKKDSQQNFFFLQHAFTGHWVAEAQEKYSRLTVKTIDLNKKTVQ